MSRVVLVSIVASVGMAVAASIAVPPPRMLIWNTSASVPIGLYAVQKASALDVPDLVAVTPPEPLGRFLDGAEYLPLGVPMLKRVAALPGQKVCRRGGTITVDAVVFGVALERDRRGRPLPIWHGCRRLAAGELFLMNFEIRDSLDGRYFGPLPRNAVMGRAIPLYTDEDGDGRFVWRATTR